MNCVAEVPFSAPALAQAYYTGDVDAAMALFADDAIVDVVPRELSPGAAIPVLKTVPPVTAQPGRF